MCIRDSDDHVLPLGQGGVLGQPAPAPLVHRQGLAGHGRLIRLEASLPQHPSVGGDVVPGLQQDDVAGHQLTALQPPLQPLSLIHIYLNSGFHRYSNQFIDR